MKVLLFLALTTTAISAFGQQAFYEVTPANGNGVRFWGSDNYKIHMGNTSEYQFGPVTDYSIKTNMSVGTPGRGWTWGSVGYAPVAAINTLGKMEIAGTFTSGGIRIPNRYTFGQSQSAIEVEVPTNEYNAFRGFNGSQYIGTIHFFDDTWAGGWASEGSVNVDGSTGVTVGAWNNPTAYFRKSDGNVGIGTTNPDTRLAVVGAQSIEESVVNVTNAADQDFAVRLSAVGAAVKRTWIGPSTSTRFSLGVGIGNEQLTIVSGGNVGIGTTVPEAKLDIRGGILAKNNNGNQLSMQTNSQRWDFDVDESMGNALRLRNMTAGSVPLAIGTNGNVGIGTTTPGSFRLAVEGKIGAREVNVTTSAWSDYVFSADYKLRPLAEVQQYIEENHHLPEVPSEKEVLANGQNLGEMNAILLKKIEELTLYQIEANKKIEALQEELKKLTKP